MIGRSRVQYLVRAGLIAAVYVALVYAFRPISFGPGQIRVAEALAVLPLLEAAAVPGLGVGCLLANLLGGMGPWDIFGGSAITFLAAYLTWLSGRFWVGILPPILLNGFGVSAYLTFITGVPYWLLVGQILFGQTVAVGLIGATIYLGLRRLQPVLNLYQRYTY